jgi:class III poly(R)-hydroxyalkanoic acid synthase PhaE subunit
MNQDQKKETVITSLFAQWTKSATDFWGNMLQMQFGMSDASEASRKNPFHQTQKAYESGAKILGALISTLSQPENLESALKGMDSLPEFIIQMAQQSWESYLELQKKMAESAAKIGQHTEAYKFEGIDQNVFKAWRDIYEKEFRQYLNVPQLGLNRFHQERIARLIDTLNIFQASLNEFIYMFYIPIEKSGAVMQEKIEQLAEKGEIHDNFKEYYNMWIKTLEGHYMTLLKSPEYAEVMNNTINALVQYREAKQEVLYDILKEFPIPTNKDMDELYNDLYILKKKVSELCRKLDESRQ